MNNELMAKGMMIAFRGLGIQIEDWYDCYYAITQTVHSEVINNMSDEALDALVDCVCAVQEALY